jgi:hypothetical protein
MLVECTVDNTFSQTCSDELNLLRRITLASNLGLSVLRNMLSNKGVAFAVVGVTIGILGLALSILGLAVVQEGSMNINADVVLGVFIALIGVLVSLASAMAIKNANA